MKIVFIETTPVSRFLYYLIANELINRGYEIEFVTDSRVFEKYMIQKNMPVYNIGKEIEKIVKNHDTRLTKEELFEKKYNVKLNDLFYADIVLENKQVNYKKAKTIANLIAWENFLNESKPSLIINWDGCDLLKLSCDSVAKKNGVPIIHTCGGGPISNTIYWNPDIWMNQWLKKEYLNQELTDAERDKVLKYINAMKNIKPLIGGKPKKTPIIKLPLKFANHIYNNIFIENDGYSPLGIVKSYLFELIRPKFAKQYYSKPQFDEKYIFLPLHVPGDAQLRLRAFQFLRQDKLVELCAKKIPESYILYVKEHPQAKGNIPLEWLKRLSLLPNVKLIDPDISAHDLIMNSQCIITINSDVGWEALFYFKPIVVLAKPFYSNCEVTFDVDNLEKLQEKIKEALNVKKIEPEKVLKLINAVMKSLYEETSFHKINSPQFNYESNNIKNLADSILTELNLMKNDLNSLDKISY